MCLINILHNYLFYPNTFDIDSSPKSKIGCKLSKYCCWNMSDSWPYRWTSSTKSTSHWHRLHNHLIRKSSRLYYWNKSGSWPYRWTSSTKSTSHSHRLHNQLISKSSKLYYLSMSDNLSLRLNTLRIELQHQLRNLLRSNLNRSESLNMFNSIEHQLKSNKQHKYHSHQVRIQRRKSNKLRYFSMSDNSSFR